MNIQEIRQKYPDYKDLSDTELAQGLHQKFYSDIPFDQFSQKIGLQKFDIGSVNVQDHVAQQAGEQPPERPGPEQPKPLPPAIDIAKQFFPPRPGDISPEKQAMLMATAATLAAPQLAIPARAAQAMGPYLSQVASQALKIPAAFLGGATGRASGEIQKGDPKSEISDIILNSLRSGGEMAAAEATGAMIGPVVSKIFAPGAAGLTDDAKGLIQFAKDKKVPFAPSSMSNNVTAKVSEGGADAFFPSR
jgi:hypothetical protein